MSRTLDAAQKLVTGDRADSYGEYSANARTIVDLWSAYLGYKLSPEDYAPMMIMVKLGRLANDNCHHDSLLDVAGYAGLGGDMVAVGDNEVAVNEIGSNLYENAHSYDDLTCEADECELMARVETRTKAGSFWLCARHHRDSF